MNLNKFSAFSGRKGPLLLIIMDGVGKGRDDVGNAVYRAYTPTLDLLLESSLNTLIAAHGTAVGLPSDADMGNSEVGHNAMGAGRIYKQGAKLVQDEIENGSLYKGLIWKKLIKNVHENDSALHFIGLFSDGNVHSHIDHLRAMITEAYKEGVKKVFIHTLLDGRDVGETSALDYILPFEEFLKNFNKDGKVYRIASGGGRMYITMDRYEADWEQVKRGWDTHVLGRGRQFSSAEEAIRTYRQEIPGIIDQDIHEFVIVDNGEPIGKIKDGDSVIYFNFRGDRAMEISRAFDEPDFDKFDREFYPSVEYAGMMQYDGDLGIPKQFLVSPPKIERTMSEYLAGTGVKQYAISETQKFGHVTYFWNGNRTEKFNDDLETYKEILSDILPFEQRPWMKSAQITDEIIKEYNSNKYDFLRLNFPNGDMVGHTGNMAATIIGVEAVDLAISRILPHVKKAGGIAIITADHGNSDEMFEFDKKSGKFKQGNSGEFKAKTSHTLNPVPFIIYDPEYKGEYNFDTSLKRPGLSNIASTILELMGYEPPEDYDNALVKFK